MKKPIEKYLEHLDEIFQTEPLLFKEESLIKGTPDITNIIYRDLPEQGMITSLTYGLSLIQHPAWKFGRPELCISVESIENAWGIVAGYIVNHLRGECTFSYGDKINFKEKIADDSDMDAFLIFAPSILEQDSFLNIDIGLEYKINIKGLYPIYSSEIEIYNKIGLEAFWHHPKFDLYNIKREKITL